MCFQHTGRKWILWTICEVDIYVTAQHNTMCASASLPNLAKLFSVHILQTYVIYITCFFRRKMPVCMWSSSEIVCSSYDALDDITRQCVRFLFLLLSQKMLPFVFFSFPLFRSYFILLMPFIVKIKHNFWLHLKWRCTWRFSQDRFFFASHSFLPTSFNSKYEHYMCTTKPIKFI